MTRVLVIGAGVAGLAAALHLLREGCAVTVLDRLPPGTGGASFGNAGMISAAIAAPSAMPGMLRQVPRWLLDPMGPLVIRPAHLPRHTAVAGGRGRGYRKPMSIFPSRRRPSRR